MAELTVLVPVKGIDNSLFSLAIESLLDQTLQSLRILILNVGKAEEVEVVVKKFRDSRLEIVSCHATDTVTEQLNRGIDLAHTELIARADADDVNEPWRLQRQVEFLESHPQIAVVGTALMVIDSKGSVIGTRTYPTSHATILKAMHRFNSIAHPTVVFRKKAVQAAGGYKFSGKPAQDYELWSRMLRMGYEFANLAEAGVRYRLHPASVKARRQKQTLLSTLEVKRIYWWSTMNWTDQARYWLEHLLLPLPPHLVQRAFMAWQYAPTKLRR